MERTKARIAVGQRTRQTRVDLQRLGGAEEQASGRRLWVKGGELVEIGAEGIVRVDEVLDGVHQGRVGLRHRDGVRRLCGGRNGEVQTRHGALKAVRTRTQ